MMRNIPMFKVFMSDESKSNVCQVLDSGFIGQGPKVEEFEYKLRDYIGSPYVNAINSATSGLHLAVHMIKNAFAADDEILTSPLTCTATNFAILANHVNIRWVDVDPSTCNMDMNDLERKISPKTKGIMLVHWGGQACDLDRVKQIVESCQIQHGFKPFVIEDCAHALGARYKEKNIGTHGNFCVFSFQAIKHLTTGDGGLLVCPNEKYHQRAKLLRWYGLDRMSSADFRCEQNVHEWGYKFHMNDIAASIGLGNFCHIEKNIQKHKENGKFYEQSLKNIPGIKLLDDCPNAESSYWIFTIHVQQRDNFIKRMKEKNIDVGRVHKRNDIHACLSQYKTSLPGMDQIDETMICIPSGWWVTNEDRDYIIETIKQGW